MATTGRIPIEQQLAALAEIGIILNPGVTLDDLTLFQNREQLESSPFSGLVEALGYDLERASFTPMCNRLWMCDFERIEDHGAYREVMERLELMTDHTLGLANITDYVEIEEEKAWVEFDHRGKKIHWDAEVDDDWLDPHILVKYDALLRDSGAPVRIYSNHTDYGQTAFLAAFAPAQKTRFDELCKIDLTLIELQA